MKIFLDSDYAANKNARGIVYRFANETLVVTLEDYLRENPSKTEADFAALKALSDADYHETDRSDYRQTWKNVPLAGMEDTQAFVSASPETEVISKMEQAEIAKERHELAKGALDKLTDIQLRRYLLYKVTGLTTRQIAEQEGVKQRSVMDSLEWAEKKIKKFLNNDKKQPLKTTNFSR